VSRNQLVNIVDNNAPQFGQLPAERLTYECQIGAMAEEIPASGVCSPVAVTPADRRIDLGCPANYTIIRTFTGLDDCGRTITFNQTVDVRDTIPPTSNDTSICIPPGTGSSFTIPRATQPGGLFQAADSCSAITISLLSCSSDQDARLGVTALGAFNSDCRYDASTDSLIIATRFDTTDLSGRHWIVNARVTDACGHTHDMKADIDLLVQLQIAPCPPE
jgi:hypothetical protein